MELEPWKGWQTMLGLGKRHRKQRESALFYILGPAAVEGAQQGHSPEARKAWKDLVERNKQARASADAATHKDLGE